MSKTETPPEERERTPQSQTATTSKSDLRWLSGFVSLVGAWIFASAFVYGAMSVTSYWNNIIVGAAIFLIAGYNYYRMSRGMSASVGSAAFVALLGLWMILAPFIMDAATAYWSDIISGAVVALVAGYNAYAGRGERARAPAGTA